MVPRLNATAQQLGIETIYHVDFEFNSNEAKQYGEDNRYDYGFGGTPLVVLFESGEFVYSNFSYINPDSDYYIEAEAENIQYYVEEILRMFDGF